MLRITKSLASDMRKIAEIVGSLKVAFKALPVLSDGSECGYPYRPEVTKVASTLLSVIRFIQL